jgi:hypothetical protein
MLLDVTFPHEPFNTYVRQGTAGQKIGAILEAIKPEAAYFTDQDGKRGAVIVVDMANAAQLPTLAEPFFLTFNADLKLRVAMTPADLKNAGLDTLGKKWA